MRTTRLLDGLLETVTFAEFPLLPPTISSVLMEHFFPPFPATIDLLKDIANIDKSIHNY